MPLELHDGEQQLAIEGAEMDVSSDDAEPGDELSQLKKLWPQLIDQINARSKNVAAAFRDPTQVRPYKVAGKVVTVSFRYPIQANRSRSEPARGVIEQALSRTLGHECVLEAILFEQEGSDHGLGSSNTRQEDPKGLRPKPPAPQETPRGRAAMNIFGIEKFEDQ
jgi:hypothetical protein